MKTILHIIDSLKTGGAEVMLAGIVPSLPEFRHVIVTLVPGNDFESQLKGFPVHCLNYRGKQDLLPARRRLRKIISQNAIDLIHSHLLSATFIARISRPSEIPLVFSVHNILSQSAFSISKISFLLEKYGYHSRQFAIFVSEEAKADYDRTIGLSGPSTVLYNFIDDDFFEEKYQKEDYELHDPPKLICIGTLKEQKNYRFLIESLAGFENFTLDIYGSGPLKNELSRLIGDLNLENKVRLKGFEPEIVEKIKQYDLLIMPSLFEGFGIALMEAMATGIATLVSDTETLRSVSGTAGVFFKLESASDLLEKLTLLLNDKGMRRSKGMEGRERARAISQKKNYLMRLKEIYQSICP